MKTIPRIFCLFPAILAGCSLTGTSSFSTEGLQKNWILTHIDGQPLDQSVIKQAPSISVDEEWKAAGFSGCNRFFAKVELKGEQLRLTGMGMTKMACLQNEVASMETLYTQSLQAWNSVSMGYDRLMLSSPDHELTFKISDQNDR